MKVDLRTVLLCSVPLIALLGAYTAAGQGVISYDFTVKYFNAAPDGVQKRVLGVNNQFPGPTIRAKIGDTLVVKVKNMIQTRENTSIHWHGIEQVLTPFEDGPEMVTQCPIVYGATQVYSFKLQQSGTYWWHSHHAWQYTDGYWGALIVDNDPEVYRASYDGEIVITLNDWYHKQGQELSDWYLSPASQGNEPIPDSVLLNGRGSYPCGIAVAAGFNCSTSNQAGRKPLMFTVNRFKTYRVRVINTSAMTPFFFSIDDHKLETIEVDGVDTVRVGPVDTVRLSAAMRYSFLVKMNAPVAKNDGGFWIRAKAFTAVYQTPPNINPNYPDQFEPEVKAILRYRKAPSLSVSAASASNLDSDTDGRFVDELGAGERPMKPLSAVSAGAGLPPPPPPEPVPSLPSGTQGRPETHGIDWNNLSEVLQLVQANSNQNQNLLNVSNNEARTISRHEPIDVATNSNSGLGVRLDVAQTESQGTATMQAAPASALGSSRVPIQQAQTPLPTTQPVPDSKAVTLNPNLCRPYPGNRLAPASCDQQVVINVEFVTDPDGVVRGKMNGVSYQIGTKPVIFQMLTNEAIPAYVNPIPISLGKVIQLVINNRGHAGHPFHLHGHTFWVLGNGADGDNDYNPARDAGKLRRDGVRRDTTSISPHSWTVIRFIADNPGSWLFHCHINWHLQSGLGAVFLEGETISRAIYQVPRASANVCRAARIQIS